MLQLIVQLFFPGDDFEDDFDNEFILEGGQHSESYKLFNELRDEYHYIEMVTEEQAIGLSLAYCDEYSEDDGMWYFVRFMGDTIRTWHVQIDSDEGHVFFGHVVDYVDEAVLKCYGKVRREDEEEEEEEEYEEETDEETGEYAETEYDEDTEEDKNDAEIEVEMEMEIRLADEMDIGARYISSFIYYGQTNNHIHRRGLEHCRLRRGATRKHHSTNSCLRTLGESQPVLPIVKTAYNARTLCPHPRRRRLCHG